MPLYDDIDKTANQRIGYNRDTRRVDAKMITKIICPKCNTEGGFSLVESSYQGLYRCWKCREGFTINMENNELKSCEPLSQEEFERQQEIEALKAKFKQH